MSYSAELAYKMCQEFGAGWLGFEGGEFYW